MCYMKLSDCKELVASHQVMVTQSSPTAVIQDFLVMCIDYILEAIRASDQVFSDTR